MKHRAKRRMKRRMLLLGMAMATTFAGGAFARGSGKVNLGVHPYSGWSRSQLTVPVMGTGNVGVGRVSLFGRLKELFGGLNYRAGTPSAYAQPTGLQLQLMRSDLAEDGVEANPRLAGERFLGLALRLSF